MKGFPFEIGDKVTGLVPSEIATIESVQSIGSNWKVIYSVDGQVASIMLSPAQVGALELAAAPYTFDAPYPEYWAALEALRISKGYLFDPMGAIHTSAVDPLPHQITAVYEEIGQMEDLYEEWVQRIRELRAAYAAASVPEGRWRVSVAKGQPRNLAYEPQPEEFARLWAKEQWDQYKLDRRQTKKLEKYTLY